MAMPGLWEEQVESRLSWWVAIYYWECTSTVTSRMGGASDPLCISTSRELEGCAAGNLRPQGTGLSCLLQANPTEAMGAGALGLGLPGVGLVLPSFGADIPPWTSVLVAPCTLPQAHFAWPGKSPKALPANLCRIHRIGLGSGAYR